MSAEATLSFKEAFSNLKTIAEKMRNQGEPDIDALVPMVDQALASYSLCKSRIETVKQLLDQKLSQTGK